MVLPAGPRCCPSLRINKISYLYSIATVWRKYSGSKTYFEYNCGLVTLETHLYNTLTFTLVNTLMIHCKSKEIKFPLVIMFNSGSPNKINITGLQ